MEAQAWLAHSQNLYYKACAKMVWWNACQPCF